MNKKYDYDLVVSLYKEGKSIREVAIVIGGNHSRVAEIVKKAGVSRPNKVRKHILEQNAKKCKPFSRCFMNYFDGLMISDGSLTVPTLANACRYQQTCIYKEWLEKIKHVFLENGIQSTISPDNRNGKKMSWNLQTFSYDQFYHQYHRWYKKEKEIPKDIEFDSTCIKNWIYGDGTLIKTSLRLCCESFSEIDIDWLISVFDKKGFIFNRVFMGLSKSGKNKWRISICKKNGLREFYKYIGDCDVDCYSYKWYKIN